jgi:DNA-directed RNA polymerase subunit M/transcription elongation factor TFIIS
MQKVDRQEIIDYRLENPETTLQGIADNFKITRERVRQILFKAGVPTKGTKFLDKNAYICPKCGEHKAYYSRLCRKCSYAERRILIPCDACGKLISRVRGDVEQDIKRNPDVSFYCSRECQGSPRIKRPAKAAGSRSDKIILASRLSFLSEIMRKTYIKKCDKTEHPTQQLAKICGVSIRTIQRDLNDLAQYQLEILKLNIKYKNAGGIT